MFFELLTRIISAFFFIALHVKKNGAFPPPLSKKEEEELLEKSNTGDINARNKLVEHNLRLVAHIAKKYATTYWQKNILPIDKCFLLTLMFFACPIAKISRKIKNIYKIATGCKTECKTELHWPRVKHKKI